MEAGIVKEFVC